MLEIERKYLVLSDDFKAVATSHFKIQQGFLNTDPARTVRIRLQDSLGFLTVKGMSSTSHRSRFEWEKELSKTDAEALLQLCEKGVIEKIRYLIPCGKHIYEVDVFEGDNQGLIVAEVELHSEEEKFIKPKWLGEEVTGDVRYYNSQLSKNPFKSW